MSEIFFTEDKVVTSGLEHNPYLHPMKKNWGLFQEDQNAEAILKSHTLLPNGSFIMMTKA
jgi:hypothetical protein